MTLALRPYQDACRQQVHAYRMRGARAILVVQATGTGKTVTTAAVASDLLGIGQRGATIIHTREIRGQMSQTFRAFGIPHGFISAGLEQTSDGMQIASIDTLSGRLSDRSVRAYLRTLDFLLIDEAHHVPAPKYQAVIEAAPQAVVVGFTASPFRLTGPQLGTSFDAVVRGPTLKWAIDHGHSAPIRYYAPPIALPGMEAVGKSCGDYKRSDISKVMMSDSAIDGVVRHYARLAPGLRMILFAVTVEHAQAVDDSAARSGWHTVCVDGGLSDRERDSRIAAFRDGRLQILSSCELVGEGFDVPGAHGAILARPTMSTALHWQQCGRATRPFWPAGFDPRAHNGDGMGDVLARRAAIARSRKPHAVIIDCVGNVTRHGLPHAERHWTLEEGLIGAPPPTARCPRCYLVSEAGPAACPDCGTAYSERLTATVSGVPLHLLAPIGGHAATVIATMDFPSLLRLSLTAAEWEKVAEIRQVAKTAKDRREWAARLAERAGEMVRKSHLLEGRVA